MRLRLILTLAFCSTIFISKAQSAEEFLNLGIDAADKGKHAEAVELYNKAIALSPDNAIMLYDRAISKYNLKQYSAAMVDLNKAIQLDATLYEAYEYRGLAHQTLKNYTFAESDFDFYISKKPEDVNALLYRALL